MQQNAVISHSVKSSRRSTLLLFVVLALIAGGTFLYTSVLTSVGYEVEIEPPQLYAGSTDSALLRVHGINRLGGTVPFSHPPIVVSVYEGQGLLDMQPRADSTAFVLRPRDRAGIVQLRVRTEAWPFPMLASVRITAPLATSRMQSSHALRGEPIQ